MTLSHSSRVSVLVILCACLTPACTTDRYALQKPWDKQAIANAGDILVWTRDGSVKELDHPVLEGVPPDEHIQGAVDAPYGQVVQWRIQLADVTRIDVEPGGHEKPGTALVIGLFVVAEIALVVLLVAALVG